MATYTKLCGILPYLIYFRWQSMRLAIECRDADKRFTGGLAVPSNNAGYNADYNADYNTEYNAISVSKLHYREHSRIRSRLRLGDPQLHNYDVNWRLQIDFRIKPFQSMFPTKLSEISRRRSNDFQRRGWPYRNRNPYRKQLPYRKYTWTWID